MRDFKGMKRQRGRNRGGGGGKPQQQNANRAFDSNGPDGVKVRGNAQHVFEKYQQLARDASSSGDRVLAENYLQHAEHYFRILSAAQPQNQQQVDNVVVNSTLPTEPATVAPIRGGNAQPQTAATETKPRQTQTATRPERKQAVIEPKRETKPQAVVKAPEVKAVPAQPKRTETAAVSEPAKAPVTQTAPKATATTAAPAATAPAATATACRLS